MSSYVMPCNVAKYPSGFKEPPPVAVSSDESSPADFVVALCEEMTRTKKGNLQKKGAEHHGLSKVMSNLESKNY